MKALTDLRDWLRAYACVKRWLLFVVPIALLLIGHWAHAETNLAIVCAKAGFAGGTHSSCDGSEKYDKPQTTDWVEATLAGGQWGDSNYKYWQWSALSADALVGVCTTDIAAGTSTSTDLCTAWNIVTKSTVPAATSTTSTNGSITLTWTAPTQNTDGSTLTDLAGYWLYSGVGASALGKNIKLGKVTTHTLSGLAAGTYYFAVSTLNAAGTESDLSSPALSAVVTAPATTPTKPNPPSSVTAVAATAYDLTKTTDSFAMKSIGTMPAGATYVSGRYALVDAKNYCVVKKPSTWKASNGTRPSTVFVQC